MFKPLTLSVSLAIALGASSMVLAGGGKSLPTPQGPVVSEQCLPTAQTCAPKVGCSLLSKCKLPKIDWCSIPKPHFNHNYTYTWVLKKKHCGPLITWDKGSKHAGCDGCGGGVPCNNVAGVYPTSQYAAPAPSGQAAAFGTGQAGTYGTGQIYGSAPRGEMVPPPPAGEEAPPVEAPPAPATSMLFLPGANN